MKIYHLSAECYPVAKVGGLADVVGALPKYQNQAGLQAAVVMPFYDRKFTRENEFEVVFSAATLLGTRRLFFEILKEKTNKLGFELYLVKIPGLLDRENIYSYPDEREQFIAFQLAFLDWISYSGQTPDVIHCHDHHSGLVPFLLYHSKLYQRLVNTPTVFTIHNGQYHGAFGWDNLSYLPEIDLTKTGLLDWAGGINPLAAAVKCCWKYTTVSPTYLHELTVNSNGLEYLFWAESAKGYGIINGIDTDVWNPQTDPMIATKFTAKQIAKGKQANKNVICERFALDAAKPLFVFIGRLVVEKGADLLPEAIERSITENEGQANFLILGSGDKEMETALLELKEKYPEQCNVFIGYDEALAHLIYAGADFLLMPSRVEPCGLNQLYSLRYGTMPLVRSTGGLIDSVIDFGDEGGYGIRFNNASVDDIGHAIVRANTLYQNTTQLQQLRKRMMALDFSWDRSAKEYIDLYESLNPTRYDI
ncbi:starch synthase [Mucilaginibacter lappiensis]|uniref:Glycogen synthase n=1 Tax=Mucilaginibacter lappiensis TaxID=354630 RepID=A0ABR6PF68_9SPHI|nr:glycogen synthase [Mucilaginibacter lappiensis]MBB6108413.1 starch synthase [Mucilaginibacter lappiensis]SIQ38782.1 starch synthase [Mucilaginibacter lappiensis]